MGVGVENDLFGGKNNLLVIIPLGFSKETHLVETMQCSGRRVIVLRNDNQWASNKNKYSL